MNLEKLWDDLNIDLIINPFIFIAVAVVAYVLINKIVSLFFERSRNKIENKLVTEAQMNRIVTLKAMIMSIVKYIAVFAVILAILANFGIDVSSLLAGLGIATAVLGLAFQDLAKDIIAGFSIITEAQYKVGDLIEVGGFRGRVTSVGLKTTRIKNYRGKEKIISNRKMDDIINYSTHDTLAEVIVSASYENDPDKVEDVLQKVKAELDGSMEQMTGEVKIFPVTGLDDSAIRYTIQCACKPYRHFAVQRAIRREVYKAFKANKIKIPYPQLEVHSSSK